MSEKKWRQMIVLTILLCACKKEVPLDQVQRDVDIFLQRVAKVKSNEALRCEYATSDLEILEALSRVDQATIKVRLNVTRNCVRTMTSSPIALAIQMGERLDGVWPGQTFNQYCYVLDYEIFDQGFKLRNIEPDNNCPESQSFKWQKKSRLESLLKETALANCYCKKNKCTEEEDGCGLDAQFDINGDGIDEMAIGDTCDPRYGCGSTLWSIVNGQPKQIYGAGEYLLKINPSNDGKFSSFWRFDIYGADITETLVAFDYNKGEYGDTRQKRKYRKLEIYFSGTPYDTEVYIDNQYRGKLIQDEKFKDTGNLVVKNLPNKPLVITLKRAGYQPFISDWDWDELPRVFHGHDGAYFGFNLQKE